MQKIVIASQVKQLARYKALSLLASAARQIVLGRIYWYNYNRLPLLPAQQFNSHAK